MKAVRVGLATKHSLVAEEYLRGAVLDSAAEGTEQLTPRHEGGRPEINQLDVERGIDDDVLVLDVAMQYLQRVQMGEGPADLPRTRGGYVAFRGQGHMSEPTTTTTCHHKSKA